MSKQVKLILLILVSVLLLAELVFLGGCVSGNTEQPPEVTDAPTEVTEAPTDAPTEAPTDPPTEAPTDPPTEAPTEPPVVIRNPLTGEIVEEEVTNRIFAVSINNINAALPHVGVAQADMLFEMYVNDYATRGLALYTNIDQVEEIGSVRSMRYNFTDITLAYDAFLAHAGGSNEVISDAKKEGIDHFNIDTGSTAKYAFRSKSRNSQGIGWVHCLMVDGPGLFEWAAGKGYKTTQPAGTTYGLNFSDDGTPAGGEAATTVKIDFKLDGSTKNTTMIYDEELGEYVYNQYGKATADGNTGEPEGFKNVFVIKADVRNKGKYHVANLDGSGDGYYACGGKLIPIKWYHENETDPFTFTLEDGTPLEQGVGSSYVAIAPLKSNISWE